MIPSQLASDTEALTDEVGGDSTKVYFLNGYMQIIQCQNKSKKHKQNWETATIPGSSMAFQTDAHKDESFFQKFFQSSSSLNQLISQQI